MSFANNLKRLRNEKDLTQKELADFLQVKQQTIAGWEKGRTEPDITNIQKIATFFNVEIEELFKPQNKTSKTIATNMDIFLEQADKMPKTELEQKALERFKSMSEEEQQRRVLEQYNSLPLELRKAVEVILQTLAASHQ